MDLYKSKYTGEEIEALLDNANYVIGTYTGDDTENRFINLGFTPKLVIVTSRQGLVNYYGGMALKDYPAYMGTNSQYFLVKIVDNGFNVSYNSSGQVYTNAADSGVNPYRYIAFK